MKKLIVLLLVLTTVLSLTGCGGNAGISQVDYDVVVSERDALLDQLNTLTAERDELLSDEKSLSYEMESQLKDFQESRDTETDVTTIVSSDFLSGTQEINLQGTTIQVPKKWSESNKSGEKILYFYPEDQASTAFLMIQLFPDVTTSVVDSTALKILSSSITSSVENSYDVVEDIRKNNSGIEYAYLSFLGTVSSVDAFMQGSFFDYSDGMCGVLMCVAQDSSIDYSEDYESIINSIAIGDSTSAPAPVTSPEPSQQQIPQSVSDVEVSPSETGKDLSTNFTKYRSGQYKVGSDIPAGEYMLIASGGKGYYVLSTDANGKDIIKNNNFTTNAIIEAREGEYLNLSRSYAIPFEEAPLFDTEDGCLPEGTYLVGLHIPAGEYKISATDEKSKGYYAIYNSSRMDEIDTNANFEGDRYITISDGQYILLSRAKIRLD